MLELEKRMQEEPFDVEVQYQWYLGKQEQHLIKFYAK